MNKIAKVASIGLLALTIFGCKKKTTKNTTKNNTTNNTTITNNTTNKITSNNSTSKTTKKETTTRKTTTKAQTTTQAIPVVYNEVEYYVFSSGRTGALKKQNFTKMIINGTVKNGDKVETYNNEEYIKASNGRFHGDLSKDSVGEIIYETIQLCSDDSKYYVSEGDKKLFKIEAKNKLSDTVETINTFYYNEYGLFSRIKSENITTVVSSTLEKTPEFDLTITYSNETTLKGYDGYTLISLDEAKEIGTEQIYNNIYLSATLNGTVYDLKTEETRTATDLKLSKELGSSTTRFEATDTRFRDHFNSLNANGLTNDYGLYFVDSNGKLRLTYYSNYDSGTIYTKTDILYNEYGYAYKCSQEIIEKNGDLPYGGYYIYDYEVEFSEEFIGITLTLDAGIGTFSDGTKTKKILMDKADQLYNVSKRGKDNYKPYEEAKLDGAGGFQGNYWAKKDTGEVVDYGLNIDQSMTLIALLVDLDHFARPEYEVKFNNAAAKEALNSGTTGATTLKFSFDFGDIAAVVISDTSSSKKYYTTADSFEITIDSTQDECTLYIYSGLDALITTDSSSNPLSAGNAYITEINNVFN